MYWSSISRSVMLVTPNCEMNPGVRSSIGVDRKRSIYRDMNASSAGTQHDAAFSSVVYETKEFVQFLNIMFACVHYPHGKGGNGEENVLANSES